MKKRNIPFVVLIVVSFVVILIACGRSQTQEPAAEQPVTQVEQPKESAPAVDAPQAETEHQETEAVHAEAEHKAAKHEEAEHEHEAAEHQETAAHTHSPEEHMAGAHDVPAEAATVQNPLPATDESIAVGAAIYAQNCAVCHGEKGEGDGPAAATLEMKPANLHEGHVQDLSDGALFWIVSHGVAETPMPPWDKVLTEEQRWQVVNFLRTFNDAEMTAHQEESGEHEHTDEADDHHHDDGEDHHHDNDAAGEHHEDDGHTHSEGDNH